MAIHAQAFLASFLSAACAASHAAGSLERVPTRPGVKISVFWERTEGARATVLLFPGGEGGLGRVENGRATSGNFLVRSVPEFVANGFNVAIFGREIGGPGLDFADRISEEHITDMRKVLEFVRKQDAAPVWLVGTSRGTVSVTAAAIAIREPAIAGLVLTSSVVNYAKAGAVPRQDLAAIRVPVLVYHHAKDACVSSPPSSVPFIIEGLVNAPVKKLVMATGGGNASGDPCKGRDWHAFAGMEKEAIDAISAWIRHPAP
jgi:pimeloyl-ACP methyl ester carboxylesterase